MGNSSARRGTGRGYLVYYILAVLIWGSEAALTKAFLLDALAPGAMLLLRAVITSLVLLPLVALGRPPLRSLARRDWAALLALSLLGTALPTLLYFVALGLMPASTTMLMYRIEPIFVILLSVVLLGQRVALRVWLLTAAAVACAYLIAVGQLQPPPLDSSTTRGVLLMLASTVLFAWATLLGKSLLEKTPPLVLVWLRFSLALPLLMALYGREALAAAPQLAAQNWFWLFWMGGISSGLAYVVQPDHRQRGNAARPRGRRHAERAVVERVLHRSAGHRHSRAVGDGIFPLDIGSATLWPPSPRAAGASPRHKQPGCDGDGRCQTGLTSTLNTWPSPCWRS